MDEKPEISVIIVKPLGAAAKELHRLFSRDSSCKIVEVDGAAAAIPAALSATPCIVVATVSSVPSLTESIELLKKLNLKLNRDAIKAIIIGEPGFSHLAEVFRALYVTDFIIAPVSPRTLAFKGLLQLSTIKAAIKKNGVAARTRQSTKGPVGKVEEEKTEEDLYSFKAKAHRTIVEKFVIEIHAPPPEEGSWQKNGKTPAGKQKWAWKPKSVAAEKDHKPLEIEGEEPTYNPATKTWKSEQSADPRAASAKFSSRQDGSTSDEPEEAIGAETEEAGEEKRILFPESSPQQRLERLSKQKKEKNEADERLLAALVEETAASRTEAQLTAAERSALDAKAAALSGKKADEAAFAKITSSDSAAVKALQRAREGAGGQPEAAANPKLGIQPDPRDGKAPVANKLDKPEHQKSEEPARVGGAAERAAALKAKLATLGGSEAKKHLSPETPDGETAKSARDSVSKEEPALGAAERAKKLRAALGEPEEPSEKPARGNEETTESRRREGARSAKEEDARALLAALSARDAKLAAKKRAHTIQDLARARRALAGEDPAESEETRPEPRARENGTDDGGDPRSLKKSRQGRGGSAKDRDDATAEADGADGISDLDLPDSAEEENTWSEVQNGGSSDGRGKRRKIDSGLFEEEVKWQATNGEKPEHSGKGEQYFYRDQREISVLPGRWVETEDAYFFLRDSMVVSGITVYQEALPLWIYMGGEAPALEAEKKRWRFRDKQPFSAIATGEVPRSVMKALAEYLKESSAETKAVSAQEAEMSAFMKRANAALAGPSHADGREERPPPGSPEEDRTAPKRARNPQAPDETEDSAGEKKAKRDADSPGSSTSREESEGDEESAEDAIASARRKNRNAEADAEDAVAAKQARNGAPRTESAGDEGVTGSESPPDDGAAAAKPKSNLAAIIAKLGEMGKPRKPTGSETESLEITQAIVHAEAKAVERAHHALPSDIGDINPSGSSSASREGLDAAAPKTPTMPVASPAPSPSNVEAPVRASAESESESESDSESDSDSESTAAPNTIRDAKGETAARASAAVAAAAAEKATEAALAAISPPAASDNAGAATAAPLSSSPESVALPVASPAGTGSAGDLPIELSLAGRPQQPSAIAAAPERALTLAERIALSLHQANRQRPRTASGDTKNKLAVELALAQLAQPDLDPVRACRILADYCALRLPGRTCEIVVASAVTERWLSRAREGRAILRRIATPRATLLLCLETVPPQRQDEEAILERFGTPFRPGPFAATRPA